MESRNQNSKWVLGECIGKGSYGTVNVGIRESDGSVFAVKSAVKDSLSSIEALENEIRILRSLSSSSPFIVEYYGDDETGSHRYLHMEYVTGGDIRKSAGVDDVELIRSYTWCLVMALRAVHSQGIVHCDVKGSNVLVGPKGVAKLADFGSSMRIHHDDDQRCKIVPRGSPLWMAPEVVRGESQTFESDIWSLGCTVIEMFTGMPAWQDCGPHTLYQIGQSNDLPEYPARLPDLGRDFLNKCLARDPELRWSCDQLLQHPFLLPVPTLKITESSPRSIFDYHSLEFSDDDHESEYDSMEISARDRIRELETTSLANWDWESEGWIEVRTMENRVEEKEEGTNWENQELTEDKQVNSQRETNNDDATWNNNGGGDGGDRCRHGGWDAVMVVVGNINIRINICREDIRVTAVSMPIDALILGELFFIFCCIVLIILPQVWDMNNGYIQKFQKLYFNFGSDSYIESMFYSIIVGNACLIRE